MRCIRRCQARENRGVRTERDIHCNAECNQDRRGTSEGKQGSLSCMESGASFARFGSATKAFHEEKNTMLSDEANGGVGPAARGGGNIKNTTTFQNQC